MVEKIDVNINIEELREILAAKGLDIRELAKEAKELKLEQQVKQQKVIKNTRKAETCEPTFEIILADYPDFVIRKSMAKTEKFIVIMPSQNSYYIKTVKNGVENKEVLTRKSYAAFTSGMPTLLLPNDFWIKEVASGMKEYDEIMKLLDSDAIRKAIIGKYYIPISDEYRYDEEMYERIPSILKAFPGKDFYPEWCSIANLCEVFGIENTKDFIKEREISLVNNVFNDWKYSNQGLFERLFKDCDFKYSSFKHYVLYDSVRMGFGDDIRRFLDIWHDTLDMEKMLYGKIKDKYPTHLLELHQQLAYKIRLCKQDVDRQAFERRYEKASSLEDIVSDYVFIAPKIPQDFYDEATAQSNCLAGYVDRYVRGEDYIMFMRKKETPEESLVTIELSLDGELKQAYQAYNHVVTTEQQNAIETWLNRIAKNFEQY